MQEQKLEPTEAANQTEQWAKFLDYVKSEKYFKKNTLYSSYNPYDDNQDNQFSFTLTHTLVSITKDPEEKNITTYAVLDNTEQKSEGDHGLFYTVLGFLNFDTQNNQVTFIPQKNFGLKAIPKPVTASVKNEHEILGKISLDLKQYNVTLAEVENTLTAFILCEKYPGCTLQEIIKNHHNTEKKLTVQERLELLANISKQLQEFNDLGYIHCDLKPENIMVNIENNIEINLIDFGFACKANTESGAGTPMYKSLNILEILNKKNEEPEESEENEESEELEPPTYTAVPQVDIYSLGIIGFELFIKEFPYNAPDVTIEENINDIKNLIQLLIEQPPETLNIDKIPENRAAEEQIQEILRKIVRGDYKNAQEIMAGINDIVNTVLSKKPFYYKDNTGSTIFGSSSSGHSEKDGLITSELNNTNQTNN